MAPLAYHLLTVSDFLLPDVVLPEESHLPSDILSFSPAERARFKFHHATPEIPRQMYVVLLKYPVSTVNAFQIAVPCMCVSCQ